MNNAFFPTDNYLIENVGKIRHIPAVIVQGRYDVVCPMQSAWELHRAWPEADLRVIARRRPLRHRARHHPARSSRRRTGSEAVNREP